MDALASGIQQRRWGRRVYVATAALCVAAYLAYVAAFGVSVVFWDEWGWTAFIRPGGVTLATLWQQHNENIFFFPNLVGVVLIRLTNWNDLSFLWLSAFFMIGSLFLITRMFWKEIVKAPFLWLPIPFLVLSLVQYENILWAFQTAWAMVLFFMLAAILLLGGPNPSTKRILIAAIPATLASYSLLEGLIVWPAGLVVLLAMGQRRTHAALWTGVAVVVTIGYFADFNFAESGSVSIPYLLGHIVPSIHGLLVIAGSVVPNIDSGIPVLDSVRLTEVVGALLFLLAGAVIVAWIREGRPAGAKVFCVALIVVSILFDLLLVPGRLVTNPDAGTISRYATFTWPMLVGTYGYGVIAWRTATGRLAWRRVSQALLTCVVVAQVVIASIVGIEQGRVTRSVRLTSADVLANWRTETPALAAPYLLPPCANDDTLCRALADAAQLLEKDHMNVFSDPGEIRNLRELGIVPGGVASEPLAIPPSLRSHVEASPSGKQAWNVLSAVYRADPLLQIEHPQTKAGITGLLLWAIAYGDEVTRQSIIEVEWSPPVSSAYFLQQYNSVYRAWALSGDS
jgi:hypothetical protein